MQAKGRHQTDSCGGVPGSLAEGWASENESVARSGRVQDPRDRRNGHRCLSSCNQHVTRAVIVLPSAGQLRRDCEQTSPRGEGGRGDFVIMLKTSNSAR